MDEEIIYEVRATIHAQGEEPVQHLTLTRLSEGVRQ